MFRPLLARASNSAGVIQLLNGARLDFWTLGNTIAGRGRRYSRIVIDEAAFAKDGDNTVNDSMMSLWEKGIKPTLLDFGGEALVCSNSNGKDLENFFYNICTDAKYGFKEYHATTLDNPVLPKRLRDETDVAWAERRAQVLSDLKSDNDPLVYAQEYLAEFVDWSGAAFFARDKLLQDGHPFLDPQHCDCVFAVIDTASKTGTENDGTAVTFFARGEHGGIPLVILDWDIVQIEAALLETWLPTVFRRLDELADLCHARGGAAGAWIEDKDPGTVLLQRARNRGLNIHAIESKLTVLGKAGRAISVSGDVYRGQVKYSKHALNKTVPYKQNSTNHLVDQVERFRVGDKEKREDDLLDTFCYGIALGLGDSEGF